MFCDFCTLFLIVETCEEKIALEVNIAAFKNNQKKKIYCE